MLATSEIDLDVLDIKLTEVELYLKQAKALLTKADAIAQQIKNNPNCEQLAVDIADALHYTTEAICETCKV